MSRWVDWSGTSMSAITRGHGTVYQFAEGCRCDVCCNKRNGRVADYLWRRRQMYLFIDGKDWPVNA